MDIVLYGNENVGLQLISVSNQLFTGSVQIRSLPVDGKANGDGEHVKLQLYVASLCSKL